VKVVSELELHFSQYLKRINVGSGQLVQDEEIHALQRETKNLTLERASNKHEEKVLRA